MKNLLQLARWSALPAVVSAIAFPLATKAQSAAAQLIIDDINASSTRMVGLNLGALWSWLGSNWSIIIFATLALVLVGGIWKLVKQFGKRLFRG